MSLYPIKMLKDEEGQPFVPLTSIKAVSGVEYIQGIFDATATDTSHYVITSDDLTQEKIYDKLVVVRFGTTTKNNTTTYLKLNDETNYPIYSADGEIIEIGDLSKATCLLCLKDNKWSIVGSTGGGGHHITDTDGNVMTQRAVLNFTNLEVIDDAGNGATKVVNNNWVKNYQCINGVLEKNVWIPLVESAVSITESGLYRVVVRIQMKDITTISKEIGVKVNDIEVWKYQHRRLKDYYEFYVVNPTTIEPQIYIDTITSDSDTELASATLYIEKLNKID